MEAWYGSSPTVRANAWVSRHGGGPTLEQRDSVAAARKLKSNDDSERSSSDDGDIGFDSSPVRGCPPSAPRPISRSFGQTPG